MKRLRDLRNNAGMDRMITLPDSHLAVAHSVDIWLPLTMRWVYNQVRYTPVDSTIVLAQRLEEPGRSKWDPVYVPTWRERQSVRFARRIGVRSTPASFEARVARHEVRVLHSHFGDRGWADAPLARKHRVKHVVTFYGYDLGLLPMKNPIWLKRYEELFRSADLFLCEGPFMADTLAAMGCAREKIAVQPLGVELDLLPCQPRQVADDGVVRILIAASFRQKKGIPLALEAVANVAQSCPNLAVTIVGDAATQPRELAEKAAILEVVSRRNLSSITNFLGYQPYDRLLEEAYGHHIFLSPSITAGDGDCEGGAPVTMIEMAATGMPIVSTSHCDIPQVVTHGATGLLSEERDLAGLTENLMTLASNPSRWCAMGLAGRRLVEERFDVNSLTARLADRYASVVRS